MTATAPTSGGRSLNAANSNIGESSENYSALIETIKAAGKQNFPAVFPSVVSTL